MDEQPLLVVDGAVEQPLEFRFEDLKALPDPHQVPDVSRFHPKRQGDGVALEAILERVRPRPEANYLTLHADHDDFHVSVPLQAIRAEGIVVYHLGGTPLGTDQGGPVRFLIRDPAACHTEELDDCANVKYLSRIELTVRKGRDTRPTTDDEHARLHAAGRDTTGEPVERDHQEHH
jgi:DMSO/TMAO reductase YedYZ molybdopterin-dependent catalytic subunit